MVDGNEVKRAVLSVDVRNELGHLTLKLGRVGQSGRRDLDEDDVADPLRVVLEQLLERAQLLQDALDDVELVAADDDLLALVQRTQGLELRLDTRAEPAAEALISLSQSYWGKMRVRTCPSPRDRHRRLQGSS